jgi:hypothetical protein
MTYTSQQQQDRLDAVKELNPNAIYNCADGVFTWIDDTTPISDADIDAKVEEIKTAYDAKQYQRDRVYPSIGDQLDMLWHSIDQNSALKSQYFDFYETVKAVKVKFPKNG